MATNMNPLKIDAVHALKQQVARYAPTGEIAAAQMLRIRRIALLAGRPIPPRQKVQD